MHNDPTNFCRVCGLKQHVPQYGETGDCPTYEFCDCCGVEFGYQDTAIESAKVFREQWLAAGYRWHVPEIKPNNWDVHEQLLQVPEAFQ